MRGIVHTRTLSIGIAASVVIHLLGCSATPPVQRRWATIESDSTGKVVEPALWVGAFGSDSPSLSIKDLSDHAAAAYIEALGKTPALTVDSLRSAIAKNISSAKPLLDTTSFDRTLVITVSKQGFQPADRLVRTEIDITPTDDQPFQFSDYSATATTYGSVNIETLGATTTASRGIEIDPSFTGKLVGSAKLTAGSSETYTDQATIAVQDEVLTVYKKNRSLVVYRESERNADLTGTTLVKLNFQIDKQKSGDVEEWAVTDLKLIDEKLNTPLAPDKASIGLKFARFAKPKPLKVDAVLRYVVRHVVKGQETYTESDDDVLFIDGTVQRTCTLITASTLNISRWYVESQVPGNAAPTPIQLEDATGNAVAFAFLDYDEAQAFVHWRSHTGATAIGQYRLREFGGGALRRDAALVLVNVASSTIPSDVPSCN